MSRTLEIEAQLVLTWNGHALQLAAAGTYLILNIPSQLVLDQLTAGNGSVFGLDLSGVRLEAADTDWTWGSGQRLVRADSGWLVALLSGRALPDGRSLPRG